MAEVENKSLSDSSEPASPKPPPLPSDRFSTDSTKEMEDNLSEIEKVPENIVGQVNDKNPRNVENIELSLRLPAKIEIDHLQLGDAQIDRIQKSQPGSRRPSCRAAESNLTTNVEKVEFSARRTSSISPVAAELLRQRLGRDVQPTQASQKRHTSRPILSPADSRAESGLVLPLRAPDELLGYRTPRTPEQKAAEALALASSAISSPTDRASPREIISPIVTPSGRKHGSISLRGQYVYSSQVCGTSTVTNESSSFSKHSTRTSTDDTEDYKQKIVIRTKPRKRAVLIGISYRLNMNQRTYDQHPESIQKWYDTLVRCFGFMSNEIWIASDSLNSARNGSAIQTRATPEYIRDALNWLIDDARKGDQLILTYGGDTAIQMHKANVFDPGRHGIVPSNFPEDGVVWDEEIYRVIKELNAEVKLTIFLDCKMSWNLIRLPYIYFPIKARRHDPFELRQGLTPESPRTPQLKGQEASQKNLSRKDKVEEDFHEQQEKYFSHRVEEFQGSANVVCFAATPTKYTLRHKMRVGGTRKLQQGEYATAAVDAIENIIHLGKPLTYRHLMLDMAELLSPPGCAYQVPQICSTHDIDLDEIMPVFF